MEATNKKRKFPPIYEHSFQEAVERGETKQYHASHDLNRGCAEAINAALAKHYNFQTYCLDTAAASEEVVGKFGFDRTMYVLANTVRYYNDDGRVSRQNKEWASTIPGYDDRLTGVAYLVRSSPGLTNMLVKQVRHDYLLTQPVKAQEVKAEAERILAQFQNLREPNSPDEEQFMVRVSPDFIARAKPKQMERLVSLLPFPSLQISAGADGRDTCAVIGKDENRYQPLQTRKPSIRGRLAAAKAAQAEKPPAQQHQKDKEAR